MHFNFRSECFANNKMQIIWETRTELTVRFRFLISALFSIEYIAEVSEDSDHCF